MANARELLDSIIYLADQARKALDAPSSLGNATIFIAALDGIVGDMDNMDATPEYLTMQSAVKEDLPFTNDDLGKALAMHGFTVSNETGDAIEIFAFAGDDHTEILGGRLCVKVPTFEKGMLDTVDDQFTVLKQYNAGDADMEFFDTLNDAIKFLDTRPFNDAPETTEW